MAEEKKTTTKKTTTPKKKTRSTSSGQASSKSTAQKKSAGSKAASKKKAAPKASSKNSGQARSTNSTGSSQTSSGQANKDEFAVIETGGKQYKVSVGDVITIEKLDGEFSEGDTIIFEQVLLVDNGKDTTIGTPYIEKAKVEGSLKSEGRAKKVTVAKFKSKSRYFKQRGHRQPFMKVEIKAIR